MERRRNTKHKKFIQNIYARIKVTYTYNYNNHNNSNN